jgi:uncharacterized protein YraI
MQRRFGPTSLALGLAVLLAPALAEAAPAYVTTRLSLRAGPSTEYPAVALLEPGVQVEVFGCLEGYEWCDVGIGQDRGWVAAGFLQAPYYQRQEPLPGVAAAIGLPIIGFSVGGYWDSYYRGRPWYGERERWDRRPPGPGWRNDRGPGFGGRGPDFRGPDFRGPDRSRFDRHDGGRPGPGFDRPGFDRPGFDRPGFDRPGPDRGPNRGPEGRGPDGRGAEGRRPDGPRPAGNGSGSGGGERGGGERGGGDRGGQRPDGDRGPPGDRGGPR